MYRVCVCVCILLYKYSALSLYAVSKTSYPTGPFGVYISLEQIYFLPRSDDIYDRMI